MAKTYKDLVADAKTRITEIEPAALQAELDAGERLTIIDVREHEDWHTERIGGAVSIPRGILEVRIGKQFPDPIAVFFICISKKTKNILSHVWNRSYSFITIL